MKLNFLMGGLSLRLSAGVYEAARNLVMNLDQKEFDVNVFGFADKQEDVKVNWGRVLPLAFQASRPQRLGYSRNYFHSLLESQADLCHLNGLWMYQSAMVYKWHEQYGKPYLTSLHGMLDPWAIKHANLKKQLALLLYERRSLKACNCFHATTEKEYNQVRDFGLDNPVAIIKNGVPIPNLAEPFEPPPWQGLITRKKNILLYFGRVHPKKGLTNLIEALAKLKNDHEPGFNNWVVVIAGSENDAYVKTLSRMILTKHLDKQVFLMGQYFGEGRKACYYHADAFILPSFSEGMPIAALEAWAYGKYSVLTSACNLPEGFTQGFSKRIEPDVESIATGLRELFSMNPETIKAKGAAARAFTIDNYSWTETTRKFEEVYRWLSGKGEMPSQVRIS